MNASHRFFFFAFLLHSIQFLESRTISKQSDVITNCVVPGTMALTFDDGPYLDESKLADYLKKHHAKGSFFVNGYNYDCIYDEDAVARLKDTFKQGHLIASHTWSHTNITLLSASDFRHQLDLTEKALMKILGVKPRYFRPPYGAYNQQNLAILRERGYTVVTWSFESGDALGVPAQDSIKSYAQLAKKYPAPQLALNHDTIATTSSTVIPTVIPVLQKAGYRLVHVSECLGLGNRAQDLYQWVGKPSARDSTWTCEGTPEPSPD